MNQSKLHVQESEMKGAWLQEGFIRFRNKMEDYPTLSHSFSFVTPRVLRNYHQGYGDANLAYHLKRDTCLQAQSPGEWTQVPQLRPHLLQDWTR